MKKYPKIGAHVSAAGGLHSAFSNAQNIGAASIQIFGASPQRWQARFPDEDGARRFRREHKASGINPVYLHGSYLVNLASPDEELRRKSITNLSEHLAITEMLGARGLIFHIGSGGKGLEKSEAIAKAIYAMREVLGNVPGSAELVMENTAGGGAKVGASADELGEMLRALSSKRVKVCFDTAHAFEAGLIESYSPENITALFDDWDKKTGLEHVVALHVNDSKTAFNSRHDRHENIGEGYIGLPGFRALARESRLWDKAWILETPGFDGNGPDLKNIELLRGCF